MAESGKRSTARTPVPTVSDDQRKLIGKAIIDGLLTPNSFSFINPLATEGGDYDQNGGGYTQSGGGNHNQGGDGPYNQSSLTANFDHLDVTNVLDVLTRMRR
ncbi:hypothetical protein [Mariluticola halotolerans]|uniref:hypothetical protein n=1 Tax=Mariluticola halotolerans TaxID=2909283 RepID=UPI0026E25CFD|nr:hypothetical protein [Mariluticola halotolerans]UJQ94878.1 hypothetical protein L1P08_02495 [Mariluticola halotolerans]